MGSNIYKLKRKSSEKLKELLSKIKKDFTDTTDFVCEHIEENENTEIILLVLEKYYYRNNSRASLTLQITDNGNEQHAIIVGAGGDVGLLNFKLGAKNDFANMVKVKLNEYGFELTSAET